MGSIVEWQSLKVQEYRYALLIAVARFWEWFGVRRPVRFEKPLPAGDYEDAVGHAKDAPTFLEPFLHEPADGRLMLGGKPHETGEPGPTPKE
jgi:hypothetical protein